MSTTSKGSIPAGTPTLSQAVYGFVVLGILAAAATGWYVISDRLVAFQQSSLVHAVEGRARGAHLDFARTLHQEWRRAVVVASGGLEEESDTTRRALDVIVGDGDRVFWAGIAGPDGIIAVASGGSSEGQEVLDAAWFQRGLDGPFGGLTQAGPVTGSELEDGAGDAREFIQLVTPVPGPDGNSAGVLAIFLEIAWARRFLHENARAQQLDLYLTDRSGRILAATDDLGHEVDPVALRTAVSGVGQEGRNLWLEQAFFSTVVPNVSYEDLPPLGLALVARISSDTLSAPRRAFTTGVMIALGIFVLSLALATFVFVQVFVRPFALLADSATLISSGHQKYPYESRNTKELILLGAAIARFQTFAQSRRADSPARTGGRRRTDDG